MALQQNPWRQKARREGFLVEEVGREVLAYDLKRHRVHCLNETAALIWTLCTGRRSVEQIAVSLDIALDHASRETLVRDAIAQFKRQGLVDGVDSAVSTMSRRDLMRKIGIGALAAGVILPIVTSIMAPAPVYAASCRSNGTGCTFSSQCCSACCVMMGGSHVCAEARKCGD